jgi:hypothetical protein
MQPHECRLMNMAFVESLIRSGMTDAERTGEDMWRSAVGDCRALGAPASGPDILIG